MTGFPGGAAIICEVLPATGRISVRRARAIIARASGAEALRR